MEYNNIDEGVIIGMLTKELLYIIYLEIHIWFAENACILLLENLSYHFQISNGIPIVINKGTNTTFNATLSFNELIERAGVGFYVYTGFSFLFRTPGIIAKLEGFFNFCNLVSKGDNLCLILGCQNRGIQFPFPS